jgi:hypothetical protein
MSIRDWYQLTRGTLFAALLAIALVGGSFERALADNLTNQNGPVMQNPIRAFFIYWLPTGVVLDTSQTDGIGNYTTLMQRFSNDASGSRYLNIVTQYPSVCGSNPCVMRNGAGAFAFGGNWTDTQSYPSNRGTRTNPLQDGDIQNEVTRAIAQNFWTLDANAVFFVITGVFQNSGALVEECQVSNLFFSSCTYNRFCAYHDYFNSGSNNIRYNYVSNASFNTAGCAMGISTGVNGQVASDREVVLMSHELFETITDPEINAWLDGSGNEIGDKCNPNDATNPVPAATVNMNGHTYNVQQQWSNGSASCVSGFGPSVKLTVETGTDDLRGDSSTTASLQDPASNTFETFTMKAQSDAGWGGGTSHIAVGPFNRPPSTAFGRIAITLTSHNGLFETNDNWNIDALLIEVLDSSGATFCSQKLIGNPLPLVRLTGTLDAASFDTPNCLPPPPPQEVVLCHVFDDGYSNLVGPSDAVFINGQHQACIPGGASGICRKWFGRCTTAASNRAVTMNVMDDDYAHLVGPTDAVFINGQNQACIPGGASGICRKWFGRGQTNDGHGVMCSVFDDDYLNQSLTSDAIYIDGGERSCIPSGTSPGTCARWWGRCTTAQLTNSCAATKVAMQALQEPDSVLVGLRKFRDHGLKTWPTGPTMVNMYYRNSPEIALILVQNPALVADVLTVMQYFASVGETITNNERYLKVASADSVLVPSDVAAAANRVLAVLDAKGSADLKRNVAQVRRELATAQSMKFSELERELKIGEQVKR